MNITIAKAISIAGSQQKLAKAVGVSQAAVSKWHSNKTKVKASLVPLIVIASEGKIKACEVRPDLVSLFPHEVS